MIAARTAQSIYDDGTVSAILHAVNKPLPIVCIILAVATLIASCAVATIVHGTPWSTVGILLLRNYGAVDNAQLANGEWWRLLTAQFVHVRQAHMLFNAITLFLIGSAVERATGTFSFALLWLLSGIAGTFASIYRVPPPFDIGSGASQALMGVVGAAIILMARSHAPRWLRAVVILTLTIQLALDVRAAYHPKPGHVVGFVVGMALALGLVPKRVGDLAKL